MRRFALVRLGVIAGLLAVLAGGLIGSALAQDASTFSTTDGERLQALAPDGSLIAVSTTGGQELCIYTVPDSELVNCVDLIDVSVRIDPASIAWSPDASALVFAERIVDFSVDGDLWLLDVESGELTNLTDDGVADTFPMGEEEAPEPFLLDLNPAWSPDGSQIAFSRTVMIGGENPAPSSLMLLDVSTGEAGELALFEEDTVLALPYTVAWSPSGHVIFASAVFSASDDERNGVWAFDAMSGDFVQLAGPNDDFDGFAPAVVSVSPRGDNVVLSYPLYLQRASAADKRSGYALLDLTDRSVEPIEPSDEYAGDYSVVVGPTFSSDGSALIFGVRQPSERAGFVIARDLGSGDEHVLAELPEATYPIVSTATASIQIGGATAMVLTKVTTATLVDLPADLTDLAPVADDAATPETEIDQIDATLTIAGNAAVLREGPSRDEGIISVLQPGTVLFRIGDAFESDDHFWIEVLVIETGRAGFVRTDFLEPVG